MRWAFDRRGIALFALVSALTGCTLSPGQPWGEITEAGATASFAPPDDRVDENGRLLTSKSYAVALDVVVATFATLALQQQESGSDVAFDPANPPPGITLCHNNDCHTEDGRILTFEEVEASLGGDAASAAVTLDIGAEVGLRDTPTALPLACGSPCVLERGDIIAARLAMTSVHVRGIAFDVLGEGGRLPPGGLSFDIVLEPPADVVATTSASIERFQPVQWTLDARFDLAPGFLDAIDFVDTNSDDTFEEAQLDDAATAAAADSVLDVTFIGEGT